MALPVILVDSATGSDTQASGAGPATALFGTTDASTDGAGTTVTLTAGTDLSGVATDGSHVIFLNDSTAGARNFGKITGTAGSGGATPTVTVADAFGLSLSGKSWAIGGKRATIDDANTRKLFNNNTNNGDAMPGWTIQLNSDQTITSLIHLYRSGDTTNGPITIQSDGTLRTITNSSNAGCFNFNQNSMVNRTIQGLGFKCSNATKTSSYGIGFTNAVVISRVIIRDCSFGGSSNAVNNGILASAGNPSFWVFDCYFRTGADGIKCGGTTSVINIEGCVFDSCGGPGISSTSFNDLTIEDCIVYNSTGDGINIGGNTASLSIRGCTVHACTGDGLDISSFSNGSHVSKIINNTFTANGNYGVRGSAGFLVLVSIFDHNNYGTGGTANTSGDHTNTPTGSHDVAVDPGFANASGLDFSVGTALKAIGYPSGNRGNAISSTRSYVDIGAAQRQEAGGGSGPVPKFGPSGEGPSFKGVLA